MAGLYIHIPFCKQACSYCDFYFLTRQQLREPFVDALIEEIHSYENTAYASEAVSTIYIGGGTPSLLSPEQLNRIFDALDRVFKLTPEEVTMELNPDDVTVDYLKSIREAGINRASMGVQSFQEELLTFMHRAHTRQEAFKALEALGKAGFETFTADLIYGNPGQTDQMLKEDVANLLTFNPPHISAYSLTIEPGTRLGKQAELGRLQIPDDEDTGRQFNLLGDLLRTAGIERYEVSNYSKPGKEAIHNSSYWNHENYLGFGPSAHSFWKDDTGARRWRNRPDLKFYLENETEQFREDEEALDKKTLAEERLMLGLRTRWGVATAELEEKYGYRLNSIQTEWLQAKRNEGMIADTEEKLLLKHEGLKIADHLIVELLRRG